MTTDSKCEEERFHPNGRLQYHYFSLNGILHRTDGPAWEEWDSQGRLMNHVFYTNGEVHRTDGPALESWDVDGRPRCAFYVNGEELTEEAFRAWQERQQRKRELRALVFALEHKFPAEAPEREFLRRILPAFVAGEAAPL